jgi:hypothetical protein
MTQALISLQVIKIEPHNILIDIDRLMASPINLKAGTFS